MHCQTFTLLDIYLHSFGEIQHRCCFTPVFCEAVEAGSSTAETQNTETFNTYPFISYFLYNSSQFRTPLNRGDMGEGSTSGIFYLLTIASRQLLWQNIQPGNSIDEVLRRLRKTPCVTLMWRWILHISAYFYH